MRGDDHIVLPDFPRTQHLPWKPNATRDDLIASEEACKIILESDRVQVTEKVDGANVGMAKGPIIRNRNHILHKGHTARTAAKAQFSPIWNWYYENVGLFDELERLAPETSVYGEWLLATHSVEYDLLPSWFLAFDLFDYAAQRFVDPIEARQILLAAGFTCVPELHVGKVASYAQLEALVQQPSAFASSHKREGVYVKVGDGRWVIDRFKMVRAGFICGTHFSTRAGIEKNKLRGRQ
jgi:atypical dual specificity phosphatase